MKIRPPGRILFLLASLPFLAWSIETLYSVVYEERYYFSIDDLLAIVVAFLLMFLAIIGNAPRFLNQTDQKQEPEPSVERNGNSDT